MTDLDQMKSNIDKWIEKINSSREAKLARVAAFEMELISQKDNLPSVEILMQEWPDKVETFLEANRQSLPSADLVCSLVDYITILSALLNIPASVGPVLSLFSIFEVYNAFEKSQHFQSMKNGQI